MFRATLLSLVVALGIFPATVFGEGLTILTSAINYAGQYADHESQSQYLITRYYMPPLFQFITRVLSNTR